MTEREIGQIMAYKDQGLNETEIGLKIGRHKSTINRFLKDPENHGRKKRPGRPRSLSPRAESHILRAASTGQYTAGQIKWDQDIPLTTRRVRQIMSESPFLKYAKRKKRPSHKPEHISPRLSWATSHVDYGQKWRDVIFSDEKKFNLDGPDGNQYYWHDLRKEPQYYSKNVMGGGSVMVWAGFGYGGRTPIAFLSGRQKATDHITTLNSYLLPTAEEIAGANWIFQQDNARIHTANVVKTWMTEKNISVLNWPAKSPDLNPIENLWGSLVRRVYQGGRQFQSADALKDAIVVNWHQIPEEELQKLINSMTNRLVEVLKNKGKFTRY